MKKRKMEFNKQEQINKMGPAINKLAASLKKKGVTFVPTDGDMENAIFIKGDKSVKVCHHWLYRYSGIASIYKSDDKNQNFIIPVEVTDEMFVTMFAEPVIETLLENA